MFKLQYLYNSHWNNTQICPQTQIWLWNDIQCWLSHKIVRDKDISWYGSMLVSIWNIFVIMFGDEEVVMCPSNVWSPHVLMCNKISSNIKTFTRQRVLQMVGKYSITKIFLIAHVGISFALFDRSQEYWMIYPLHILTAWKH